MKRREFIALLGAAAAGLPLVASAQEQGRTYRVGFLYPNARGAPQNALFEMLAKAGFVEKQNLIVEWRTFGQRADMTSEFAAELVKLWPDVMVAGGDPAIRALEKASSRIPIVGITEDMLSAGFVNTLAKPGGNTTGVSVFAAALDLKRQDLLLEAIPKVRRVAALADASATPPQQAKALQAAARQRNVDMAIHWINRSEDIVTAIDNAKKAHAEAINVLASPFLFGNRSEIIKLAGALRLPAIYQYPEVAEEGGLIGYGPRLIDLYRGPMAEQLIAILRGAKAADVPAVRPDKFELAINLQTAKAIGLDIPEKFASRADKLIR